VVGYLVVILLFAAIVWSIRASKKPAPSMEVEEVKIAESGD
jgi:hypothetical protein